MQCHCTLLLCPRRPVNPLRPRFTPKYAFNSWPNLCPDTFWCVFVWNAGLQFCVNNLSGGQGLIQCLSGLPSRIYRILASHRLLFWSGNDTCPTPHPLFRQNSRSCTELSCQAMSGNVKTQKPIFWFRKGLGVYRNNFGSFWMMDSHNVCRSSKDIISRFLTLNQSIALQEKSLKLANFHCFRLISGPRLSRFFYTYLNINSEWRSTRRLIGPW